MDVTIRDANVLKLRLGRSDVGKSASFLLGAPFSFDRGKGVPGVDGFLDVVRERVRQSGAPLLQQFETDIAGATDALRYQAAMGFVYDAIDADAAAEIVTAAVLRARKPDAPPLDPATDYDGLPGEWEITRGQHALARAMKLAPSRFSGPIFTTNFDPLTSLALMERGFEVDTFGIALEGSVSAPIKQRNNQVEVFHLHGYWRKSATLHRPQQLLTLRPQLEQSLRRHLDGTHLIVMAYSGWDDIFTKVIENCLVDGQFGGTVSWCFYETDPDIARARNEPLFEKFAGGIAQGRISFFCGIDCHLFFDELIHEMDLPLAVRSAVEGSPMPGWQLVTPQSLDVQAPLTAAEAVRFFDGAVPTLRHAISPMIPRLSHVDALMSRLAVGMARGCEMQLLRAAGGEGKSTALLQAAAQAARGGDWTVLYRPATDAGISPEVVAQLDPVRKWLIVADDAEELIDDLWLAADELHAAGRQNVFFLLSARDTDWRLKRGDAKGWSTRLNRLQDLMLGRIGEADAGLVVDAWSAQGEEGLRALKDAKTREARIGKLLRAERAQNVRNGEGSFFGGLLDTRFGASGLIGHLLPLLEPMRHRPIHGGTATLFDALLYVANCHATGMPGLDNRVLATLCGVPVYRVSSAITTPLGKELGAAESRGHVLTRHRRVAEGIVIAAARSGSDLGQVWADLVRATLRLEHAERFDGKFFNYVAHSGTKLKRDLPQVLDQELRGEIGIAAAEAAMATRPERSSYITDMARALRFADQPKDACDLLEQKIPSLKNSVDKAQIIRGYFYEWSICAGNLGGRSGSVANAWLAACALSDALPVDVTLENVMRACNGLGVAFEHLIDGDPRGVYAKGRRAVTELGWQTNPDPRAAGYLTRTNREVDALGTPKPADNGEALAWLAEAAFAAWQELDDTSLRNLKRDGRLTFQRLRKSLSAT